MVSILILSCSLNAASRSRVLAQRAEEIFRQKGSAVSLLDLKKKPLPFCDGDTVYGQPEVKSTTEKIKKAQGILVSIPIYNYGTNAVAKNLIELTGEGWEDKVVGFICAAGGKGSYMSVMSLANSLMLDFGCFILPRFVYVTEESFEGSIVTDPEIDKRIQKLAEQMVRISYLLKKI